VHHRCRPQPGISPSGRTDVLRRTALLALHAARHSGCMPQHGGRALFAVLMALGAAGVNSCGGEHRALPRVSRTFPMAGVYFADSAAPGDRIEVVHYGGGVAGTLVVSGGRDALPLNLAFVGRMVAGHAVLAFTDGNGVLSGVTPTGFTLGSCSRWMPAAHGVRGCHFTWHSH
jgi:hypothetical protein